MLVFGLTGGIASGKSTVAAQFRAAGVPIVDADVLSRKAVAPGTPALAEITRVFGPEILADSGELDRSRLAQRVFGSETERTALNQIVHPRVRKLAEQEFSRLETAGETLVGYEIPLLFETGQQQRYRPVVVVNATEEQQLDRAVALHGWSREHALRRIRAQLPLKDKLDQADFVIDNTGDARQTRAQVQEVLLSLQKLARGATGSAS